MNSGLQYTSTGTDPVEIPSVEGKTITITITPEDPLQPVTTQLTVKACSEETSELLYHNVFSVFQFIFHLRSNIIKILLIVFYISKIVQSPHDCNCGWFKFVFRFWFEEKSNFRSLATVVSMSPFSITLVS